MAKDKNIKEFFLDTNVLLHDPDALFAFAEHDVHLPITVIKELDMFKKGNDEINANARKVLRTIEHLTAEHGMADIQLGDKKGRLHIHTYAQNEKTYGDDIILEYLQNYIKKEEDPKIILVTKDTALRIRARVIDIEAQDYQHDKKGVDLREFLSFHRDFPVTSDVMEEFYSKGRASIDAGNKLEGMQTYPNQHFILQDGRKSGLARYVPIDKHFELQKLIVPAEGAYGIRPRNKDQSFLMDACLDEKLQVVSVLGKAGTGKTVVTLACALQKTIEEEKYQKIVVIRPVSSVGEELGYLPGDIKEKTSPYFGAISDAFGVIDKRKRDIMDYLHAGDESGDSQLELITPTFIRGRNIPNAFIIVDEAQNLTPKEIKTIATRMGEGSKIVCLGDPYQIDTPYLDEISNGLTYLTKRLLGEPLFSLVVLDKTVRSAAAELLASKL